MGSVAISYIRFSNRRQALGDSKRRQLEQTQSFCERHGLTLDPSYTYEDLGVSAYVRSNAVNGELGAFLAIMNEGKIPAGSVLVVESMDRISRDKWHPTYQLLTSILEGGVRIGNIYRAKIITLADLNDPYTIFELMMECMRANNESQIKSERGKAKWEQRRKQMEQGKPVGGKGCPWLQLSADRLSWIVLEGRKQVMVDIFTWCSEGLGADRIAKKLNERGLTTWHRGKPFTDRYVWILLKDRRVLGEIEAHSYDQGERNRIGAIKGYYPTIIDEKLFAKAELAMRQRTVKRGRSEHSTVNLFRGLLYDAVTGSSFGFHKALVRRGQKTSHRIRLMVRGQKKEGEKGSFRYEPFEEAFLKFVVDLKPSDFTGKGDQMAERIATISGQLTLVNEKIEETKTLIKDAKDAKSIRPLLGVLQDFEAEKDSLKAAYADMSIKARNPTVETVADAQTLIDLLKNAEDPNALKLRIRSRVRQLISEIWLYVRDAGSERMAFAEVHFHDSSVREFACGYGLTRKGRSIAYSDGERARFRPEFSLKEMRHRAV